MWYPGFDSMSNFTACVISQNNRKRREVVINLSLNVYINIINKTFVEGKTSKSIIIMDFRLTYVSWISTHVLPREYERFFIYQHIVKKVKSLTQYI